MYRFIRAQRNGTASTALKFRAGVIRVFDELVIGQGTKRS